MPVTRELKPAPADLRSVYADPLDTDNRQIILSQLGEVFTYMSSTGWELLLSPDPLIREEWQNLNDWSHAALRLQPDNDLVKGFFEEMVQRGINDCSSHIATLTVDGIHQAAAAMTAYVGEESDRVTYYWRNASLARNWLHVLHGQLKFVRHQAEVNLAQLATVKIVIPYEVLAQKAAPQSETNPYWIEAFSQFRYTSGSLQARHKWMQGIRDKIEREMSAA